MRILITKVKVIMKTNRFQWSKPLCLMLAIGFAASGCTKNFDDINTPKDVLVMDESLVGQAFAQAQYTTMTGQYQVGQNLYADIYAQYFATTHRNFNSDQFSETAAWTNIAFNYFYASTAPQLFQVEQFTEQTGMPVENALAKIWRVEAYHRISDYFGPIMYSEFGNGKTSVGYDSQEAAYKDFFTTLDEAVAVLEQNRTAKAFGPHDQMYGGDAGKWLTFANSLRLRLAMRIVYADPVLAQSEAEKAVAAGVMLTNDDNAGVLSTINSINGLSTWTYINEFRMSAAMNSVLAGFNDPRLSEFFNEAGGRLGGNGGYKGLRNGLPAAEKADGSINDAHSFVDTKWLPIIDGGANLPNVVMSAAEVYFLRAEGALRGWNMGGTAEELYNEGIRVSLEQWTSATPAEIAAYINSTATPIPLDDKWNSPAMTDIPVAYQSGADFETQLEQIITQKWIALYPDGREAWAERRRTGYPRGYAIINSLNPDIPTTGMMRRLMFTTGEISTNSAAVEAARELLNGPDVNHTRLWWDAKPLELYPTPAN